MLKLRTCGCVLWLRQKNVKAELHRIRFSVRAKAFAFLVVIENALRTVRILRSVYVFKRTQQTNVFPP